jgi:hypothetical protein
MADETAEFELHAAKAFCASAWADACEESDNAVVLSGQEIFDVMPDEIDAAAVHAARTLRMAMERENGRSIGDLLGLIERDGDGDRPNTVEHFGHYSAMQAMGHGVGLYDAFGSDVHDAIKVPYVEFGSHSLSKDYF